MERKQTQVQTRRPFENFTRREWERLGLVALLFTYLLIFAANLKVLGIFNYVGIDFRTFYSSAQIATVEGFAKVYDLHIQEKYQLQIFKDYAKDYTAIPYETVPTPYFPIFIVPFVPFTLFKPGVSFTIYSLLSLGATIFYSLRFTKKLGGHTNTGWIILGIIVSLPSFLTFFYGQVNVWLLICLGEFLLSEINGKHFTSGLWLSGWIIKPQLLIFLLPWMVFKKRIQPLLGFLAGCLGLIILSTCVAGIDWFQNWLNLLVQYPGSLATTNPQAMMNWRAFALNLSAIIPSNIAWEWAWLGIGVLMVATIKIWFIDNQRAGIGIPLLTNLCATFSITWHSHLHTALPLVIPLLFLIKQRVIPKRVWSIWLSIPTIGFFLGYLTKWIFPENNISGTTMLLLNTSIVAWMAFIQPKHFEKELS